MPVIERNNTMHAWVAVFATIIGTSIGVGCVSDGNEQRQTEAGTYQSMVKINARPFSTQQHQGNPLVNVWTNSLATAPYRAVSMQPDSATEFPVGAMIVKEMFDADGAPAFLTVMVKQSTGFDSANRDWWYGRLNADGTAAAGNFVGKVGFCIGCHAGAPNDNYLFGVAADNLAP